MMSYRSRMFGTGKPLDNPVNWSFRVGSAFGIDIRVHLAFVLCAVVMISMEIQAIPPDSGISTMRALVDGLGSYAILFAIILLHEFGHCWGARHTGGEATEILLWPLGGLAAVRPPHTASAHIITTISGPMVNVIICVLGAIFLTLWFGTIGAVPWNPIHPTWPANATLFPTTGQAWLLRVYGISYFILLINLIPVFPFDGGRIVQAWLWPRKGYQRSMEIATSTGMFGAIIIGLFSFFLDVSRGLMLMIAVFGYLTCWQMRRAAREQAMYSSGEETSEFAESLSYRDGDDTATVNRPGMIARYKNKRALEKTERQRAQREAREHQIEEILRKVAQTGMAGLSTKERQLLESETKRKRSELD